MGSHTVLETDRELLEKRIAPVMAQSVIDILEVVVSTNRTLSRVRAR